MSTPIINITVLTGKIVRSRYIPSIWHSVGQKQMAEIIIDGNLVRPDGATKVFEELLRCAVLHYCSEHGLKCRSRNGTYCNKLFHDVAVSHGLVCKKDIRYGYKTCGVSEDAAEILKKNNWYFTVQRERFTHGIVSGKNGSRSIKYTCAKCGNSVRATKEVNILCLDCGLPMIVVPLVNKD